MGISFAIDVGSGGAFYHCAYRDTVSTTSRQNTEWRFMIDVFVRRSRFYNNQYGRPFWSPDGAIVQVAIPVVATLIEQVFIMIGYI